jgi:beta-aspartyl-dipeptidase (metallo-type)
MVKMDFATSAGLPETIRELAARGHSLDSVLPSMTSNVARLLRLPGKGRLAPGCDADLVCFDPEFRVRHVMALGRWMIQDGLAVEKGVFEG